MLTDKEKELNKLEGHPSYQCPNCGSMETWVDENNNLVCENCGWPDGNVEYMK